VVAAVGQIVAQVVYPVTQHQQAAGQCGDGLCGLRVTGDDSELFAHGAKLPGVDQYATGLLAASGRLGKRHSGALLVIEPFNKQLVVLQGGRGVGGIVGHGGGLSMNQICEQVGMVGGQPFVGAEVKKGRLGFSGQDCRN